MRRAINVNLWGNFAHASLSDRYQDLSVLALSNLLQQDLVYAFINLLGDTV